MQKSVMRRSRLRQLLNWIIRMRCTCTRKEDEDEKDDRSFVLKQVISIICILKQYKPQVELIYLWF